MLNLLLIFSLLTSKLNYCSCTPLPPIDEQQYKEYDLILKGKVSKISVINSERMIDFAVETFYKGQQNKARIKITTPSQEGMCGIIPKVGERWLVFAYADKNGFHTELCTRTKNMNPKAWDYNKNEVTEDLKFLEAKRNIARQ